MYDNNTIINYMFKIINEYKSNLGPLDNRTILFVVWMSNPE